MKSFEAELDQLEAERVKLIETIDVLREKEKKLREINHEYNLSLHGSIDPLNPTTGDEKESDVPIISHQLEEIGVGPKPKSNLSQVSPPIRI